MSVEIPLVPHAQDQAPHPGWKEAALGINDLAGNRLTPFLLGGTFADLGGDLRTFSRSQGDPVLEDVTLLVAPWSDDHPPQPVEQGLESAGPAAYFLAVDWPIESSVTVTFPAEPDSGEEPPAGDPRVGVYRQDKDRQWELVGPLLTTTSADSVPAFSLGAPGLHAVMRDTLGPFCDPRQEIRVGFHAGQSLPRVTLPRWEVVPVHLADAGSGVDPGSIRATLDGSPIIVEPDLLRDQVLVELPDELAPGTHTFYLEAADDAGNASSCQLELICRESR